MKGRKEERKENTKKKIRPIYHIKENSTEFIKTV